MCGIIGIITGRGQTAQPAQLEAGTAALRRRGPDDWGAESFDLPGGAVSFGHTRLSIIDLTPAGRQPMASACGRYTIVFNGEIYNYRELREDLKKLGYRFRTNTDTEVLLNAWAQWGVEVLNRLCGMYAFAILELPQGLVTLVRDAFGIKPLYYHNEGGKFSFASEIPALVKLLAKSPALNIERACDYLVYGRYDDGPETLLAGVKHLPSGHVMTIDLSQPAGAKVNAAKRWWWPPISQTSRLSYEDAAERLREMFLRSVRLHLRSDVPLGAALSGGVDSSAIVCAIRKLEPDAPLHTFTFIAPGSAADEEKWADIINAHVGATPHKVKVSAEELATDLDDMILSQGEPFASTSIYAQYRVFKCARENGITVALDGQGADELFAGYEGYPEARMRSLVELGQWGRLHSLMRGWGAWPGRGQKRALGIASRQMLSPRLLLALRKARGPLLPAWLNPAGVHRAESDSFSRTCPEPVETEAHGRRLASALRRALTGQGLSALLRHGDRNSMRWSVESRVPFLTLEMAEFVLTLPEEFLLSQEGETKHIFREAMKGIVPDVVLNRKDKIGFLTPERAWLRQLKNLVPSDDLKLLFLHHDRAVHAIRAALAEEAPWNAQCWRLLNFHRWVSLMGASDPS